MHPSVSRLAFSGFAGLLGAAGVALAAVAAHGRGESQLAATAAGMALVHAPALLALAAMPADRLRFARLAGFFLALGVVLFSGDLAKRFFLSERLFEGAAPAGGILMIAGWLLVTIGALAAALRPVDKGGRT